MRASPSPTLNQEVMSSEEKSRWTKTKSVRSEEAEADMRYCGFLLNHKAIQKRQLKKEAAGIKHEGGGGGGGGEAAASCELKEKRCRMQKKKGRQFCPQHEIAAAEESHKLEDGGDTTTTTTVGAVAVPVITASSTNRVLCPYGEPKQ